MDVVDLEEMGLIDGSTEYIASIAHSPQIVYSQNGSININSEDLTTYGNSVTYVTIPNIVHIVQDGTNQNVGYLINDNQIPIVNRSIVANQENFVELNETIDNVGSVEGVQKDISQFLKSPGITTSGENEEAECKNLSKDSSPFCGEITEERTSSNFDHNDESSEMQGSLFCETCNLQFASWKLYKKHKWKHMNDKPFKCSECHETFNYELNLNLHMATHNIENPFCPVCKRKFGRIAGLKAHIMLHEQEESVFCSECGEEFNSHIYLQRHMAEHQSGGIQRHRPAPVKKSFPCGHCDQKFELVADRKEHLMKSHKVLENRRLKKFKRRRRNNECDECHKCFEKPSQLLRHKRIHTGERPYECQLCTRAFSQKGTLQIHMLKHTRERPYVCEYCRGTFSQKGNLQAHIKRLHIASDGDERHYKCHLCSCIFRKLGSLNAHFTKAHSVFNSATFEKPFEDNKCQSDSSNTLRADSSSDSSNKENENAKSDENKSGLVTITDNLKDGAIQQHLAYQRKLKSLLCSYCSKEFRRPGDLVRHVRTHTHEKPFKCKHCCKSFALQSTLTAHVQTHVGGRKFFCPTCNKCYSTTRSLKLHKKKHLCDLKSTPKDTEIGEIVIDELDFTQGGMQPTVVSFDQVDITSLNGNIIVTENGNIVDMSSDVDEDEARSVQNTYKCLECNVSFKTQFHLSTHLQTHKQSSYNCELCQCTFTSKNILKAHLKQHLSVKQKCDICEKEFQSDISLKQHKETVHTNSFIWVCPMCGSTFKSYVSCRNHMAETHPKLNKMKPMKLSEELEQVNNTHSTEGPSLSGVISCENMTSPSELRDILPSLQPNHVYFIANDDAELTLSTISSKPSLQDPQLEGLPLYEERTIVTNTISNTSDKQLFENSLDNCIFTLQPSIDMNTPIINAEISDILPQAQALNRCEECNLVFTSVADFAVHKTVHNQEKTLNCINCDENFTSTVEYEEHSKAHYFVERLIQCSSCQMEFLSEEEFQAHSEKYHLNSKVPTEKKKSRSNWRPPARRLTEEEAKVLSAIEPDNANISEKILLQSLLEKERYEHPVKEEVKPQEVHRHKCKYCTKSFRKSYDLIRHLRTHTGERPYQCTSCNKRFSIKSTASNHMKTHTKDRSFECYVCSKHFATTGSLKIHMRLHTGFKPYACTLCDAKFRTSGHKKAHLIKHMKQATSNEESKRKNCDESVNEFCLESEDKTKEKEQNPASVIEGPPYLLSQNSFDRLVGDSNEEYSSTLKISESGEPKDIHNKAQKYFLNINDQGVSNGEAPKYFLSIKDGTSPDDTFILEDQIIVTITNVDSATSQRTNQGDSCRNVCLGKFDKKQDLDLHNLTHDLQHNFSCPECAESFSLEEELKAHKCVKSTSLDLLDHDLFLFPNV